MTPKPIPTPLRNDKTLIGMIHVAALPGTPNSHRAISAVIEQAVEEARLLVDAGFDALIVENMHDAPYLMRRVGPEIVASMTAVACAVRAAVAVPMGVQVLAGANREALAVAQAAGAQFIRAEGFIFSTIADEGLFGAADAGPLLRYRRAIGATDIGIWADVKKKHSAHAVTADVSIGETAAAAEFCGADGVIVTGTATGQATRHEDVVEVRRATKLPVVVGSGVTPDRVASLLRTADALIVGSYYKQGGHWAGPPDSERAARLVAEVKRVRDVQPSRRSRPER